MNEKKVHCYIRKSTHLKIKELARRENKKLMPFIDEILDWAIGYKNFSSKYKQND
jgi:hypothetical protein